LGKPSIHDAEPYCKQQTKPEALSGVKGYTFRDRAEFVQEPADTRQKRAKMCKNEQK